MKLLTSNAGLKKGDTIAYAEKSIISHGAGTPGHYFEDVTFNHALVTHNAFNGNCVAVPLPLTARCRVPTRVIFAKILPSTLCRRRKNERGRRPYFH